MILLSFYTHVLSTIEPYNSNMSVLKQIDFPFTT